jgi:hypothetical protein
MSKDLNELKEMTLNKRIYTWEEISRFIVNRKMNVPLSLALVFKWHHEKHKTMSMKEIIEVNKEHNSIYVKYADEVEKYLMLV